MAHHVVAVEAVFANRKVGVAYDTVNHDRMMIGQSNDLTGRANSESGGAEKLTERTGNRLRMPNKQGRADDKSAAADLWRVLMAWFGPIPEASSPFEWSSIPGIARQTKTVGLLAAAMDKFGAAVPNDYAQQIAADRQAILLRNLNNLDCTIKAVTPLQTAQIDVLVFKGALRARQAYGGWELRASADIDLLVHERDYRSACEVLSNEGWHSPVAKDSSWWHDFLRESPMIAPHGTGPVVDLHYDLQQPGGPYPHNLEGFFASAEMEVYGGVSVHIPSFAHALLICAINYGKAVRARDPWLHHAHEFVWCYRGLGHEQRAMFLALARENGLSRLVEETREMTEALFAPASSLHDFSDRKTLFLEAIGQSDGTVFNRSRRFWHWTDGSGPIRLTRFAKGLVHAARSEQAFRREEARKPHPGDGAMKIAVAGSGKNGRSAPTTQDIQT